MRISLKRFCVLILLASALSLELCREETIGARPVHRAGEVRFYGTPTPVYLGIADADLKVRKILLANDFYLSVALNSLFALAATFFVLESIDLLANANKSKLRSGR